MATALSWRDKLQKLEEELECSLCLERLQDPRVFPQCQHSFCYECIEHLSRGESTIFCPECRAEVEVGIPPDLSQFKRNTRINNILECIKNDNGNDRDTEDGTERAATQEQPKHEDSTSSASETSLDIGSKVEVISKSVKARYGTIRWLGYVPNCDKKIAGLEMEEEIQACTDGTFLGKRYFSCPDKRAFFVYLHNCLPDSRIPKNSTKNSANEQLTKPANNKNPRPVPQATNEEWTESKNENPSKLRGSKDDQSITKSSSDLPKDKFSSTFYILLKETCAKKRNTDYSYSVSGPKSLLRGEILIRNYQTSVESAKETLRLHLYGKPSYYCDCPVETIMPLADEEAMLLLSFKSNDERYKYFTNSLLDVGKKLTIGNNVYVKIRSPGGGTQEVRGVIRYKGPLPDEGTMFGVELLEGKGRGTTAGFFRGQRYFRCEPNCDLFVSLEKLRPCEERNDDEETKDESIITKVKNKLAEGFSNFSNLVSPSGQPNEEHCSKLEDKTTGHKLDDKVWVFINDELCGGFLKYIGRVPGGGSATLAGINMDNPVGQGDGAYYGNQLFTCQTDHAYFTPLVNVLTRQQFPEQRFGGQFTEATVASGSSNNKNARPVPQATNEEWTELKNENLPKLKGNKDDQSKNKSSSDPPKDKFSYTFYILLKEIWAKKRDRAYSHSSSAGVKCLRQGEILVRNLTTVVDSTNGTLRLHPYDKGTYYCDCPVDNISPLEDEEAKLLLSFKSNDERYKYFTNMSLDFGKKLTIGNNVYVKIRSPGGGTQELRGVIRYKGPLLGEYGTMFGVELLEGKGKGTTDGLFRGQRYFQCDPNCGLFVALEKLRPYEGRNDGAEKNDVEKEPGDESILTKVKNRLAEGFSNFSNLVSTSGQPNEEHCSKLEDETTGHKLNDKVWVFINDELCGGVLKYIGRVPGGGGEIHAGIYLDKPIGHGNGEYYGHRLFSCPRDHAFFTFFEDVISQKQFKEMFDET